MVKLSGLAVEIIGLQTARGRLLFFGIVTLLVFLAPYEMLGNLSIWQHLGIPSPSIGLTRAYWKLIHLDPAGAWERNKLIYLILAVGIPLLLRDCYLLWYNNQASRTRSSAD